MSILAAEQRIMAVKSAEEIKKQLEGESESDPQAELEALEDPKMQEKYTFDFAHTDGRGKVWSGKFTNKILNGMERRKRGLLRASLCGGIPITALDGDTYAEAVEEAHLKFSLTECPGWAKDLSKLYDGMIQSKLYEEALSHEDTFCGRRKNKENSPTEDSNNGGESSVVVEAKA